MKKFVQISMCVALLGGSLIQAKHDGAFNNAADAAKGATFVAAGTFLATEQGRAAVSGLLLQDKNREINSKHVGIAGATGLATLLIEHYGLHNQLRKLPAVGDTVADFVEDHKYGVAMGTVVAALWLCNHFLEVATTTV